MFYTTKKIELNNYDTNYINMNAIQHSKNLVLHYGFNSGIILMKASNSDDMFWIDFEDFQRVKDHTWSVDNGYIKARINMQLVRLHRFVKNVRDDILIDHKNRNKLDNRKSNLRECNNAQNLHNSGKNINNTSGFKGVYFDALNRRWRAEIHLTINGVKNKLRKRFNTLEEAARQYDAADEAEAMYSAGMTRINQLYPDMPLN